MPERSDAICQNDDGKNLHHGRLRQLPPMAPHACGTEKCWFKPLFFSFFSLPQKGGRGEAATKPVFTCLFRAYTRPECFWRFPLTLLQNNVDMYRKPYGLLLSTQV